MREFYFSVDVEASGPVPGEYSMLSLGACRVDDPSRTFYIELKPLSDNFEPNALRTCGLDMAELKKTGADPKEAMLVFKAWVRKNSRGGGMGRPVFVAFNAPFDWMFVQYYFNRFSVRNPFGFTALDMKAYYMGMKGCCFGESTKGRLPKDLQSTRPHTHNALDDALEQAEIFAHFLEYNARRLKPAAEPHSDNHTDTQ